jgi:transcription elongation factor Elf1
VNRPKSLGQRITPERENPLPTVDPCPFCARHHWTIDWDDVGATWVRCVRCGACGPKTIPSCTEAILAWNERAGAPTAKARNEPVTSTHEMTQELVGDRKDGE